MPQVKTNYPFSGALNANRLYYSQLKGALYNMVISQMFRLPSLKNNYDFLSNFTIEAGMLGDQILVYDPSGVAEIEDWRGDAEAADLLSIKRADPPHCQSIVVDQAKHTWISTGGFFDKQGFQDASTFQTFNDYIVSKLNLAKQMYENGKMNCALGTTVSGASRPYVDVDLSGIPGGSTASEIDAGNRMTAQIIAETLANELVMIKDYSTEYNDYGEYTAYSEDDLMFVVNSKWLNKLRYASLPQIYHTDGLLAHLTDNVLPDRFFGDILTTADAETGGVIAGNKVVANGTVRSMVEKDYTIGGVKKHVRPGEYILKDATVGGSSAQFKYEECYKNNNDIIGKIMTKDTFRYAIGTVASSEWYNPRAHVKSNYLLFISSDITRLLGQPCVTIRVKPAE